MALLTTTTEADARLVSRKGELEGNGFVLTRMWPFIDATLAVTLTDALRGTATINNPKADNLAYSGTFVRSDVESKEGSGDNDDMNQRYVNIVDTLIKVATVSNIDSLAALQNIIIQENEILNAFGLDEGEEDIITYIFFDINPASRAAFMAISDANMVSSLPGSGWTYVDRKFEDQKDGTARVSVIFKKETYLNVTGSTPDKDLLTRHIYGYENVNDAGGTPYYGIRSTKTDGADGIPTDNIEEIRDNQAAQAGYAITDINITDNKDGSSSLRRRQVKQRSATSQFVTSYSPQNGGQEETQVVEWYDLSATDAATVYDNANTNKADMTGATPAAPTGHVLKTISRPVQTGVDSSGSPLFDIRRITYKPLWNFSTFNTKHDIDEEVQWKYDQVTVYDSGGGAEEKDRTIWRKPYTVYDGGSGAVDYADLSTDYYDKLGIQKHMGYVEFIGTDGSGNKTWAAYKVLLT